MDMVIRDLPEELHAELTRRAAAEDRSLRAYLRDVLTQHVATPTMDQWLQQVRDLGPSHDGASSGADLVADPRVEDDEQVGR